MAKTRAERNRWVSYLRVSTVERPSVKARAVLAPNSALAPG